MNVEFKRSLSFVVEIIFLLRIMDFTLRQKDPGIFTGVARLVGATSMGS